MQRNIDDSASLAESKENQPTPEVIAATNALVEAIHHHDLKAAAAAIKNHANVNAVIAFSEGNFYILPRVINVGRHGTPLHHAISTLQLEMVTLLLENNADPNIQTSWKQSSLEVLLEAFSRDFCGASLGKNERYTPALFERLHVNRTLSRPITFTAKSIEQAENILDVLLCYGLNPKPELSQQFLGGLKDLETAASHQINTRKNREMMELTLEIQRVSREAALEEQKASWLKKKFVSTLVNAQSRIKKWSIERSYKLGENKTSEAVSHFLPELINSIKQITAHTEQAASEIEAEKKSILSKYRAEIEDAFPKTHNPIHLANIVLQYAIDLVKDFNQKILEKRRLEKRTLHFWQQMPAPKPEISEIKKYILLESVKMYIYLEFLDKHFGDDAERKEGLKNSKLIFLIAGYAVEPKQEVNLSSKLFEYQTRLDIAKEAINNFVKEQQDILEAKLNGTPFAGTPPATLEDLKKYFQENRNQLRLEKISELERNISEITSAYLQESIKLILLRWGSNQSNASASFFIKKPSQAKQLKAEAKSFGYECKDMKHDGNCFFHAIADQLALQHLVHLGADHKALRAKALAYIFDHQDEYKNYLDEHDGDINNFIGKNIDPGNWADHLIISAMSRALNVNIVIVRSDGAAPNIFKQNVPVATFFIGNEVGLHYQSLIENPNILKSKSLQIYVDAAPVDLVPAPASQFRLA